MTDAELDELVERRANELIKERERAELAERSKEFSLCLKRSKETEEAVASKTGYIRIISPYCTHQTVYANQVIVTESGAFKRIESNHFSQYIVMGRLDWMFSYWWEHPSRLNDSSYSESEDPFKSSSIPDWNPKTDAFVMPLSFDPFEGVVIDRWKRKESIELDLWDDLWRNPTYEKAKHLFENYRYEQWYRIAKLRDEKVKSRLKHAIGKVNEFHKCTEEMIASARSIFRHDEKSSKTRIISSIKRRIRRHRASISTSAMSFFKAFAGAAAIKEALRNQ